MQFGLQQLFVWQLHLIFRDQRRRQAAVEGVLDDLILLAGAQQYADGRILVRFANTAIQRFKVEIQLAQIFRLKTSDLELDGDKTVEPAMEEQQIKGEITAANLYRILRTDEAEIAPNSIRNSFSRPSKPRCRSVSACTPGRSRNSTM